MSDLPYVYAALLDVLGYRERLDRDKRNGRLDFKNVLENSLGCLASINDAEFSHQAISDTIILTCFERMRIVEFLQVLRDVQRSFLRNYLFLRGGVTFQQHFRSGSITYSPALAGAHELEMKLAVYPRIVVDKNIVEMLESSGDGVVLRSSRLLCECNGVFFVNIIDRDNWNDLYLQARAIYREDSTDSALTECVFSKHLWFQEYLFSSEYAEADAQRYMPTIRVLSVS